MKVGIYTVYDQVAGVYQHPFVMLNDDVATRVMRNSVNNPEHNFALNPEDYTLYRIGWFDDEDGSILMGDKQIGVSDRELICHIGSLPKWEKKET